MANIQTVLNENFLDRLAALQKGEKREGNALRKVLSGGTKEATITTSIRAGSKLYAKALTGINFSISFLNFARADLTQISDITDKLIDAVGKAASPSGSKNDRIEAQQLMQSLGSDIKDILKGAEVGDRKYLTGAGLQEVFTAIGLDPDTAGQIEKAFNEFVSLDADRSLADPSIPGKETHLPKELGKAAPSQNTKPLFDSARTVSKIADAYATLDDLQAFSDQIKNNIEVVDKLGVLLQENAILVRTTAIAFLEISDALKTVPEAAAVARDLQRRIIRDARTALSQAENLEPIVVATLNYKENGIVVDSAS